MTNGTKTGRFISNKPSFEEIERTPIKEWCFTFGCDDVNSRRFVRVVAKDSSAARDTMFSVYGTKWAFQYDNDAEFAKQIERWNLTELAVLYHK